MKKNQLFELIKNAQEDEDINSLLVGTDIENEFKFSALTLNAFKEKIKNDNSMLHKFKVEKPEGAEEIGKCPECGNSIIEGEKGFGCINWKNGCTYTIWKNDKFIESLGKMVTKEMVELLLKNGKVGFRNLRS